MRRREESRGEDKKQFLFEGRRGIYILAFNYAK
jgi:hypothetical protein